MWPFRKRRSGALACVCHHPGYEEALIERVAGAVVSKLQAAAAKAKARKEAASKAPVEIKPARARKATRK